MDIKDVENLAVDDLKAQRAACVAAARTAPDVAERYVAARIDAKVRDAQMAVQGARIKELEAQAVANTRAMNEAQQIVRESENRIRDLEGQLETAASLLQEEKERANRLRSQADRYTGVVMHCAAALNKAIADQQTEVINQGG